MSAYRIPGTRDNYEEDEGMKEEQDYWAVEKVSIAGIVTAIAVITAGVVGYHYIDVKAPCREVRNFDGSACPVGAHVERVGDETWCKCGPPVAASGPR